MKRVALKESLEYIGPVDEELLLTADYVHGHATAEQEAEFERRFVEEDAFFEKVSPLVAALHAPVNWAAAVSRPAAPTIGVPPAANNLERLRDEILAHQTKQEKASRRFHALNTGAIIMTIATAAAFALWILGSERIYEPDGSRVLPPRRVPPQQIATDPSARPQQGADRPSVNALKILDAVSATVSTGAEETRDIETEKGTIIRLRPNTVVRYAKLPLMSRGQMMEVRGEVAVLVSQADFMVRVVSKAGRATLMPGSYALRCVGACEVLEISVAKGLASVQNDEPGEQPTTASTGHAARAPRNGAVVIVPADSALKFPKPDSTLAARKVP